uniref:Pre-hexon-linking protein VIII n=1 Tax=Duck adenovirus 1 TaxID=130329 RepID=A2TF04_DADV1|nr:pVIII protein [Duck adenovirus 1]
MQPVTPYLWRYQPETGTAAGARQDYGAVINWFNSGPDLYRRIRDVNISRNNVEQTRALARTPLSGNFNRWTAAQLTHPPGTRYRPYFPVDSIKGARERVATQQGQILAGAGYDLHDGRQYRKITRDALPFPHNWQVKDGSRWLNLGGKGANSLTTYPVIADVPPIMRYGRPGQQLQGSGFHRPSPALLTEGARVPRSHGMTVRQFVHEFPPVVFNHPFSEDITYFPKEFNPLFNPSEDYRASSDRTLQYV